MRQPEECHRLSQKVLAVVALMMVLNSHQAVSAQTRDMMVRISAIQIHAKYLDAYTAILKEEAEASVRLEPGVIAIFPMSQRDDPTEFRILEIYASRAAYESHLKTPHFQKYKTTTLQMVKSLKLIDMRTVDAARMASMFGKLRGER
jgi:quinol monooxygenase YgiN